MPIPTWSSGQVLTASDVNSWFVPLAAYKTASQSVTSSTTFANDNDLVIAVAANAKYIYRLVLQYDGATAGDIKIQFTVPAGAAATTNTLALDSAATGITNINLFAGGVNAGALGAGVTASLLVTGMLTTAGTAGNMQLQWAQLASSGTATRVLADSFLIAQRVN